MELGLIRFLKGKGRGLGIVVCGSASYAYEAAARDATNSIVEDTQPFRRCYLRVRLLHVNISYGTYPEVLIDLDICHVSFLDVKAVKRVCNFPPKTAQLT